MKRHWESLLQPLARAVWWYLGLIFLRELVRIAGGYSMSATLRFLDFSKTHGSPWHDAVFLAGLALYFEIALRLNGATLWHATTRINVPLYKRMRAGAFGRFFQLPLRWHQKRNSAALLGEVNNGIDRVHDIVDTSGWELLPLVIATLITVVPLVWYSPFSMLVIAVTGVVFVGLNYRLYITTQPYRVARCDWQREDWQMATDYVRGLPAVLMANRAAYAQREYETIQDHIADTTVQEYRCEVFRYGRWRERLVAGAHIALIATWLHQLRSHSLTVVDCIYVWRISEDLLVYMEGYSGFFEQFLGDLEPVKRYFSFLDETAGEKLSAPPPAAHPAPASIRIDLREIAFRYDDRVPCLEGISVTILPGEVVAIVGTTGCGKSTLAKIVCGLLEPSAGEVLIDGRSAQSWWSPAQVRSLIGYVAQLNEAHFFSRSIADNIRFSVPDAPMEKVIDAARAAGLHEDILKLPDQYEGVVGESGCTLSGGQLQRLLIARELLKDAAVLILDEPMSAQDTVSEEQIVRTVVPRLAGKTVIVISHRLTAVRGLVDRILVMDEGRIVESGAPRDLLRVRGRYFQLARARQGPRGANAVEKLGVNSGLPHNL
jgi:ABC-type multidrug transport system fused ATPase/permease subunit